MRYYIYKNEELLKVKKIDYEAWMDTYEYMQMLPEWSHNKEGIHYRMEASFNGAIKEGEEIKPFILFLFENSNGIKIGDYGANADKMRVEYFDGFDKIEARWLQTIGELAPD